MYFHYVLVVRSQRKVMGSATERLIKRQLLAAWTLILTSVTCLTNDKSTKAVWVHFAGIKKIGW